MVRKRTVHSWTGRCGLQSMNQALKAEKRRCFDRWQGLGSRRGYVDSWHRPSNRSLTRRPLCASQNATAIAASCGGGAQGSILHESTDFSLLAARATMSSSDAATAGARGTAPWPVRGSEDKCGHSHARGHAGRQQEAQPDSQGGGVVLHRQLGLLTLEEFHTARIRHGKARRETPRSGQLLWGRPVSDPHAGKYGELTPSRQRGGGGSRLCPTLFESTRSADPGWRVADDAYPGLWYRTLSGFPTQVRAKR